MPTCELAQRHQVGIGALAQPGAPRDELVAEITEVRHRSPEAGAAETQEDQEHRPGAVAARRCRGHGMIPFTKTVTP